MSTEMSLEPEEVKARLNLLDLMLRRVDRDILGAIRNLSGGKAKDTTSAASVEKGYLWGKDPVATEARNRLSGGIAALGQNAVKARDEIRVLFLGLQETARSVQNLDDETSELLSDMAKRLDQPAGTPPSAPGVNDD